MTRLFRLFFLGCFLFESGFSYGQNAKIAPDLDPQGAVLCHWSIVISLKAIGTLCYRDRDRVKLEALELAIGRMNDFIKRNSDADDKSLARQRQIIEAEAVANIKKDKAGHCGNKESDTLAFYELFRTRQSPLGLQQEMDKLLAVDRPPVMNPCL